MALPIRPLTFGRATAQSKTFKFFLALGAVDVETPRPHPHRTAIPPAIGWLVPQPTLFVPRIARVIPIAATVRTEPIAPVDHAIATGKAFGRIGWLFAIRA